MARIALVTNSVAALPPDLVERYGITLLPMQINFLDGNYEEGLGISTEEFYERLEREEVIPTTWPPSILSYVRMFRELAADYDAILSIHMASALSDSYRNAQAAARQVEGVRVLLHDSGDVGLGTGFQVLTAARMIERGGSIDDIMAALQRQRQRTLSIFTPATLRYMRNSRRVGPLAALVATWLNIKPIIIIRDGRLSLLDRARSLDAALDRHIVEVERFLGDSAPAEIGICHGCAPAAAAAFAERVGARFPKARIYVSEVGAILASHMGPGLLGLHTYKP